MIVLGTTQMNLGGIRTQTPHLPQILINKLI
jgi:hypothetical protein